MADLKYIKTTSSKSLDGKQNDKKVASLPMPRNSETQILNNLANNLTESYQIAKQKQQKYFEISAAIDRAQRIQQQNIIDYDTGGGGGGSVNDDNNCDIDSGGEWQQVCSAKNKLKRKKKLSASLTSVNDTVNQEKRTRIEGIQLNCRGKLQINDASKFHTNANNNNINNSKNNNTNNNKVVAKTPNKLTTVPPTPPPRTNSSISSMQHAVAAVAAAASAAAVVSSGSADATVKMPPPPRLKRKMQENIQTIQKLNALTEQLRLEINELKSSLTTERGAVRVLRAQNESETRKYKNEVKKLQNTLEQLKKNNHAMSTKKPTDIGQMLNNENMPSNTAGFGSNSSLAHNEIQRLTIELQALKDANKALEERKMINCDADRRKAADMRTLKDSYEIRLTQLTKSAKTEISRLLEEIKTKDRNIGQLKKEMQLLQNKTTTINNTTTNTKTTLKPKKTNSNQSSNNKNSTNNNKIKTKNQEKNETEKTTNASKTKEQIKDLSQAQDPNEMKKLKDIELYNNEINLETNVNLKATKILNNNNNNHTNNNTQNNIFKSFDKTIELKPTKTQTTPTTNALTNGHEKEYETLPYELNERLLGTNSTNITTTTTKSTQTPITQTINIENTRTNTKATNITTTTTTTNTITNDDHEYRTKDNQTDSDSALSSAPPSISPQPPPAGMESSDIWQTIRTYTSDIDKLQKELEILQKENVELQTELTVAKEHILDLEKSTMEVVNNDGKLDEYMERVRYLEEREDQLQAEANELREQNELLEFRILELEESNDKWSLQSQPTQSTTSNTSQTVTVAPAGVKDIWTCGKKPVKDDVNMLNVFSNTNNSNIQNTNHGNNSNTDSGITSPQSPNIEDELNLMVLMTSEELRRRVLQMLKKSSLGEEERQCLQQVLAFIQQIDTISQRSGPNSLNTNSSSDDASSLDLVKSRISDYSSGSSSSSARSNYDNIESNKFLHSAKPSCAHPSTTAPAQSRIVATVQPYTQSYHFQQAPTNTPTESPRKTRHAWQCNSLTESGVFVESDFLSDISENNANVCTQTDFIDESQKSQCIIGRKFNCLVPGFPSNTSASLTQFSSNLNEQKRLQYYKERLDLLESKVLIYESSGDVQAKRLADRLQREICLEKQLKELRDRVECLQSENALLEEEKCEFEEAENDTRLRLQRLEIEQEILSQRNIELEMSKEALSAKYKDCRSECLILRDDLSVYETQVRHLEADKQKAKENLEFLHSILPLYLIYNSIATFAPLQLPNYNSTVKEQNTKSVQVQVKMGNVSSDDDHNESPIGSSGCYTCPEREIALLKDEIKCLRRQIKELNARHFEAMESADTHWLELEREFKDREQAFRAKEICLKQKINKLEECVREDARAANEKIVQMEEAEKELKMCLLRVSKEHRDLSVEHETLTCEYEKLKEKMCQAKDTQKPINDALEEQKKLCKGMHDEISFLRKVHQEQEKANIAEIECLRAHIYELKKEYLNIEVTNGELKEEVNCLEKQIQKYQSAEKEHVEQIRCLTDEVRNKNETVEKLENKMQSSEAPATNLAQELSGSPSKRFKRNECFDLKTAATGLETALRNLKQCENSIPTHQKFESVAFDVKRLADSFLTTDGCPKIDENYNISEVSPPFDKAKCGGPAEVKEQPKEDCENCEKINAGEIQKQIDETQKQIEETEKQIDEGQEQVKTPSEIDQKLRKSVTIMETQNDSNNVTNPDLTKTDTNPVEEAENKVTVGMVSNLIYNNPTMLAGFSGECAEPKKQICEVPSELRKISKKPTNIECDKCANKSKKTAIQRHIKRRSARLDMSSSVRIRIRRQLQSFYNIPDHLNSSDLLQQQSDIDIGSSEVLQRQISYTSFYSVKEYPNTAHIPNTSPQKSDAYTETNKIEFGPNENYEISETDEESKIDATTETEDIVLFTAKKKGGTKKFVESSVQVEEDLRNIRILEAMPKKIHDFILLIKNKAKDFNGHEHVFNLDLCKRYEADEEFRNGLMVLRNLTMSNNIEMINIGDYENFVEAMSCLHVLEELFKPIKIPYLQQIEDQLNEELMKFHRKKLESEFYCTVYYPIKRETRLQIKELK